MTRHDFTIGASHRRRLKRPAVLFRSLATMVGAGIPLHESLELLSRTYEDELDAEVLCEQAAMRIASGWTLSAACYEFPGVFTPYMIGLIQVGEKTGALAQVLSTIASHLEKEEKMQLKLRSALTYPLILCSGALLMLCVGPSYLLKGQLSMLQDSGTALPFLTRALMFWSALCTSPLAWVVAAALSGLAVANFRTHRHAWRWRLYNTPGLSKLLRLATCVRFARALRIALQVGLPILEAIPLCGRATGDPVLESRIHVVREELSEGESLRTALEMTLFFPTTFLALVGCGEEAGKLPPMLAMTSDFAELELDTALKALTTLIEPVLLFLMGVITALVLVATLQPTLLLLRSL